MTKTITLYSAQSLAVSDRLRREGEIYSKERFVKAKYQESAIIFQTVYGWFVRQLPRYVKKPASAEYPYWGFVDRYSVEAGGDSSLLILEVPLEEVVLFDLYDWVKLMRLEYLGETEAEEIRFRQKIKDYGIRHSSDIMTGSFYPDLKREIEDSWQRLFRHNDALKAGDHSGVRGIQAGLWRLKKDWL
ncbi:MAG TPA: DUF3841 domain-containing protein [Tissierellia bacterium]|nr:DUF3841 domain-containing protein [Tissierellia bacterium]